MKKQEEKQSKAKQCSLLKIKIVRKKLISGTNHVAYPSEQLDMSKLEEYYTDLEMKPKEYFNNKKRSHRFQTKLKLSEFRKVINRSDWTFYSPFVTDVNAIAWNSMNSIQLTAAYLQGFLFSDKRPMVMNFGSAGSAAAGHELTHGFDDQGKHFDSEGNLEDWWEPETDAKYCKTFFSLITFSFQVFRDGTVYCPTVQQLHHQRIGFVCKRDSNTGKTC